MGGPHRVPIFPLRTVLVPGMVLPLHIFEPRYRLMIQTLADRDPADRGFGVVAIRPGADPCAGMSGLYRVGTMARITEMTRLTDGRYDLVTVGARRFTLDELDQSQPYLQGSVRLHSELLGDPAQASVSARMATRLLGEYRARIASWGVIDLAEIDNLPTDPIVLSYLVGAAVVVDLPARQRLLGIEDAAHRLAALCDLLREELRVMSAMPSMPAVDLAGARPSSN